MMHNYVNVHDNSINQEVFFQLHHDHPEPELGCHLNLHLPL